MGGFGQWRELDGCFRSVSWTDCVVKISEAIRVWGGSFR